METQYKLDPCGLLIPPTNHLIEDLQTIKKITTSLHDLKQSKVYEQKSNKSTTENSENEEESLFELIFHTKSENIYAKIQHQEDQGQDVFSPKNNAANIILNQSPLRQNQQANFNVFSSSFIKTKKQQQKKNQQSQEDSSFTHQENSQQQNDNQTQSFNKPTLSRISSFNKIQLKKQQLQQQQKQQEDEKSPSFKQQQSVKFAGNVKDKSADEYQGSNLSNNNNNDSDSQNISSKSPASKLSMMGGGSTSKNFSAAYRNKQHNPILPSKFQGGQRNSQQADIRAQNFNTNNNNALKMRNSGILQNLGNEYRKSLPFINPINLNPKKNKKISFAIFEGEGMNLANHDNDDDSSNDEKSNKDQEHKSIRKQQPKSIFRQSLVDIMQKNSSKCTLELNNNNFPSPLNSGNKEELSGNNFSNNNKEDLDYVNEESIVSEGDEYEEEENDDENVKAIEQYGLKINVVRVNDYDLTSIINENKAILYPKINNIQLTNSQLTKCNLNYQNCMPLAMRQALAYNDGAIDPLNCNEQICKKQFLNQTVIYPFYVVGCVQGISNSNSKFINGQLHLLAKEKNSQEETQKIIDNENKSIDKLELIFGKLKQKGKKTQIATIQLVFASNLSQQEPSLLNSVTIKKAQIQAHQILPSQLKHDVFKQSSHFGLKVDNNQIFIKDLGSSTGTFVRLKNGSPLILNKSQLIMINTHAGFYVKSVINTEGQVNDSFIQATLFTEAQKHQYKDFSQDFFDENGEYDILCINQRRKAVEASQQQFLENRKKLKDLISKQKCPAIKLVFVKKAQELEMYEEYKTQIILYNNNMKSLSKDFIKKNYVKFGHKAKFNKKLEQQNQQENSQLEKQPQPTSFFEFHLIDQIILPYDLQVGYDIQDKIWFLNSEQINSPKQFENNSVKILKFDQFNYLGKPKTKKPHHISGLNIELTSTTINQQEQQLKEEFQVFDNTEFNVKTEDTECFGPWVSVGSNFTPINHKSDHNEWIHIGQNSQIGFDQKVFQIKLGKFKQII